MTARCSRLGRVLAPIATLLACASMVACGSNSNPGSGAAGGSGNDSGGAGGVSGALTTAEVCTHLAQIGKQLSCPGFADLPTAVASCSVEAQDIPTNCLGEYMALLACLDAVPASAIECGTGIPALHEVGDPCSGQQTAVSACLLSSDGSAGDGG